VEDRCRITAVVDFVRLERRAPTPPPLALALATAVVVDESFNVAERVIRDGVRCRSAVLPVVVVVNPPGSPDVPTVKDFLSSNFTDGAEFVRFGCVLLVVVLPLLL